MESEKKDTFAHAAPLDTGSSGTLSHTVGSTLKDTLPYTEGKNPAPVLGDETEGIIQPFHSFVLAFTMIIFSEIGDKTFLVAALMAMRHPQLVVFDNYGNMYFQRTLEDWAKFDINNRTRYDATISSGLAIMANQKHLYQPKVQKESKIRVNFARYNNKGNFSQLVI